MTVLVVYMDVIREAIARKWFLALALSTTIALAIVGLALRLDVVDGALAASRLFGQILDSDIKSIDIALRPVFQVGAYAVYYIVMVTGVFGCSGFGPSMLAPGRIEHLLSLPVRRIELLLGTYLGVVTISSVIAMYGTIGLVLILGVKTGYWNWGMISAGWLAAISFAPIYASMLVSSLIVRSAPFCGLVGISLVTAGIVAGYRENLLALWEPGIGRTAFELLMAPLPKISSLAQIAGHSAASAPIDPGEMARLVAGSSVFAAAVLAFGAWLFEKKDF